MNDQEKTGLFSCTGISWIVGALLGFAAYLILRARYDTGFFIALIVGLVLMVVVAVILRKVFCTEVAATEGGFAAMSAQRAEERRTFEAGREQAKAANDAAEPASAPKSEPKPAPEPVAKPEPKPASAPKAEAAAKPAAQKAPAQKAPAQKAPAKKAAGKSATKQKMSGKTVAADGKPEMLKGPRESGADDLKQIKGVGPKLEKLLNSLGVYHFDQIAGWHEKEIEWMDEHLEGFRGRVTRDAWVKQATALAKGESTEFSRKVKKGGVY